MRYCQSICCIPDNFGTPVYVNGINGEGACIGNIDSGELLGEMFGEASLFVVLNKSEAGISLSCVHKYP